VRFQFSWKYESPRAAARNPLKLLVLWLINAVALMTVAYLLPGIVVSDFLTALVAALVLGLVNAVIRPLLILLTLPATLLSLGLFIFVINGLLFWWVGSFVDGFHVGGFWSAFFGAMVYSVISWLLSSLLPRQRD
jgi:putative membrane protein